MNFIAPSKVPLENPVEDAIPGNHVRQTSPPVELSPRDPNRGQPGAETTDRKGAVLRFVLVGLFGADIEKIYISVQRADAAQSTIPSASHGAEGRANAAL